MPQLRLMHQETEAACTLEGSIGGEWNIKEPALLPTGLLLSSPREASKKVRLEINKKFGLTNDNDEVPFKTRRELDMYNAELVEAQVRPRGWLGTRIRGFSRTGLRIGYYL